MEHIQEHAAPLSLDERIAATTDYAYSLIEDQGNYSAKSPDRIGYFDGENGEVHYTIEEENQFHVDLECGVGYGHGFSSSTTIKVTSKDVDPVTLGSFHEWPAKNTQLARVNETRLTDPQEIEQAVFYVEFVMDIVKTDIAKRALRKQAKTLRELRAFTKEFELEVDEATYFLHAE